MPSERSSNSVQGTRGSRDDDRRARRRELPPEVVDEVVQAVDAQNSARVLGRLGEATYAFQRERWSDARSTLAPLVKTYPHVVAIRELHGLVLYKMERWKEAAKDLEAVISTGEDAELLPVLADCYRAMGRHAMVESLWERIRQSGVGVEILTEGRIVTAGSRADQGKLREAIALLEEGPVGVRKPQEHHLRLWYALASTYERAGDLARARRLFKQLQSAGGNFSDVDQRLSSLS